MKDFIFNNNNNNINIYNNFDINIYNSLKSFILKQINNERELTQNKINLLLKYSQKQIFNFFLTKNNVELKNDIQNYISSKSIINIFNSFTEKEINKIIKIYDKDQDLFLNYKEFYYFISPKYIDANIDELRAKNKNNINNDKIDEIGIKILFNIFNLEIKNYNELSLIINIIINNLNLKNDINIYFYLFKLIKGNDKESDYINEYLVINDILKFMNKSEQNEQKDKIDIKIYEQDIANFIFRFDYDNDLKLSFNEFTNMINYFINNNNNTEKNNIFKKENKGRAFSKNRNQVKLFYDYSSLNIDTSNGSQIYTINKIEEPSFDLSKHIEEKIQNEQAKIINENRQNSFINNISLTYNELDDVLSSFVCGNKINYNFNGNNIDINSIINIKTKDLQDIKINLLVEFFKILINELNEVELIKEKIIKEYNININNLFSLFDLYNERNISLDNFINMFNKYFNKKFVEKDIIYLIKKYDKNKDNKLNYNEFCYMILPTGIEYKNNLQNNFYNKNNINLFNEDEKKIILNLFLVLIKCEETIQNQKIKMTNCPFFTYFEMFEFIRNKENKLIKSEDISYFLKSNNILITDDELDILLNYLFFSTEKNKTYCFRDFMRLLQPK